MTAPRELATVQQYGELVEALRQRCIELDVPFSTVDDVAGLPDRYVSKLLSPNPLRGISRISWCIFEALGLRLVLIEDPAALAKAQRHPAWRERKYRRPAA